MPAAPDVAEITGLVLAGGQGERFGGLDKGLVSLEGEPMVVHAARRLAPQVAEVMVSANRHLDAYRALGWSVVTDTDEVPIPIRYDGPLAGVLAGMRARTRPWLAIVPCDTPALPRGHVARLAEGLARSRARIALAETRDPDGTSRLHPTVALVSLECQAALAAALTQGQRKLRLWMLANPHVVVHFDDAAAFRNLNTPEDLARHAAAGLGEGQVPVETGRS